MRLVGWSLVSISLGCSPVVDAPPRAAEPARAPATPTVSSPPPSPSPASPSPSPAASSRRGECPLSDALANFLGRATAIECGVLPSGASLEDYERLRVCVVAAARGGKTFTARLRLGGLDSSFEEAYAGRGTGGSYEVRSFSYDSCPSGCGDADPGWSSQACHPLVDLRSACPARKLPSRRAIEHGLRRGDGGRGSAIRGPEEASAAPARALVRSRRRRRPVSIDGGRWGRRVSVKE